MPAEEITNKIFCFLCGADITNKWKHSSLMNFPEEQGLYLCTDCHKKDLELAHAKCVAQNQWIPRIKILEDALETERARKVPKVVKFLGITITF